VHINDPAQQSADPVAVLHIHGLADIGAPFYGGPSQKPNKTRSDLPAYDCVHFWIQHNNCQQTPEIAPHQYGSLQKWSGGTNGVDVQLVTAPGLGHEVPRNALAEIAPFVLAHQK
jgi:poly(3-hydroxybutyrate) depolymerase